MLYSATQTLLLRIEQELKTQGLWGSQSPGADALASSMPFCCDLMPFEQWLQYVFLVRMYALIAGRLPLPDSIAIAPMAQHVWGKQAHLQTLIMTLNDLDILLNEPR